MQPIKSNITSTGKCLNPVTTKCVVWDGPDITCLDGTTLCKGQNVETTLYTLATKLCEIYTALSLEDINTCINNINDGTSVSIGPTSSIKEVFSAIIKKLCTLDGRVQTLEDTPCLEQTAIVPECLRTQAAVYPSYNPVTFTLPLQYYAELVANSVCGLLIDIQLLQTNANTINQQIDDLWLALQGCSASAAQNYVLPTCTYNWSVSPNGDPVSIQTAFSWLEADYCTLRGLLGTNSQITSAINSQCAALGSEDTLTPGLGGTLSNLPGWSDTPSTISDAITNMWLTVCDMRSYVAGVLNLCCKSPCDYFQLGFVPLWSTDGTTVTISFIDPSNPVTYEDGAVVPDPSSPYPAAGTPLPAWVLTQFPTASQTGVQFVLDDGNGYGFTVNTGVTINGFAQTLTQYDIDFSLVAPVGYDQTSLNQTITIIFNYDVVVAGTTTTCAFNFTTELPYICNAPKPYNCNGELQVTSTTGTDLKVVLKDLVEDTASVQTALATGPGTGSDTLEDTTSNNFTNTLIGYVVTITSGVASGQCRYIVSVPSTSVIQLDSDWDTPPANGDGYEIKNKHYGYSSWGTLGITGFNITVSTLTSNFDINDSSTWNTQISAPNVSPITVGTSGYLVANNTLAANTEYVVIISAVYPCGESELVTTNNYNQIAASVHIQQGNPTNFVFNVLNATVTVTDVYSNGTALPDGFAANYPSNTDALYALALPQGVNVTQIGVTPNPAQWLPPLGGTGTNFCICGITTDPDNIFPGTSTPNHDAILGQYRGYDVELYKIDNLNNYIPIVDSTAPPTGPLLYKTNSLDDPTLQFPLNTPHPPPIIVDVPSNYTLNNLPIIVRYDPTPYIVNPSPTFHEITLDPLSIVYWTSSSGPDTFRTTIYVEVKRWNSTTNQYVSYSPQKLITYDTTALSVGSGVTSIPLSSFISQTNTDPTAPATNKLRCKYGDALYVWVTDAGGPPPFDSGVNHNAYIQFYPKTNSKFSCKVPTLQTSIQSGAMGYEIFPNVGSYLSWDYQLKAIITEDYNAWVVINSYK